MQCLDPAAYSVHGSCSCYHGTDCHQHGCRVAPGAHAAHITDYIMPNYISMLVCRQCIGGSGRTITCCAMVVAPAVDCSTWCTEAHAAAVTKATYDLRPTSPLNFPILVVNWVASCSGLPDTHKGGTGRLEDIVGPVGTWIYAKYGILQRSEVGLCKQACIRRSTQSLPRACARRLSLHTYQ